MGFAVVLLFAHTCLYASIIHTLPIDSTWIKQNAPRQNYQSIAAAFDFSSFIVSVGFQNIIYLGKLGCLRGLGIFFSVQLHSLSSRLDYL